MKKKTIVVMMIIFILSLREVNATEFSAYLPGGKNYLDVANMIFDGNTIMSDDSILVKPSTEYTLSFPGFDLIGENIYLEISGLSTYLIGDTTNIDTCITEPQQVICHFTTNSTEDLLYIEINSPDLESFYNYYGFVGFQLEEGPINTNYEEYIAPYIDTTTPEFSGVGAFITSYQNYESISSIINNHIVAYDDIDGDLTDNIIVISDEYTTNEQIIGEYNVVLSVSDTAGNEALFTLTIMVKDEIVPVISGPDNIEVSVGNQTTIISIIEDIFIIYDDYDVSPITNILIDNYTNNSNQLGEYLVSFEVIDSSQNISNKTFIINIIDDVDPIMISNNIYNSNLSNPLILSDILDALEFTDNYDDLYGITPSILADNFSANSLIPGSYQVSVEVSDNSGNILNEILTINVIDDIYPSISGPINYSSSYDNELVLSDFIDMLSVDDNIDTLENFDIYVISDTFSNRITEVGNFVIIFGIMDTNNNETIHQMNINIFDGVAPIIYVDNYVITVSLNTTFNENDALKLLLNSQELQNGNYTIATLFDEYTGNESNPGSYIYRLAFTDDSGNTFEKEFLVRVSDSDSISFEKDLLPRNIAIYSSIIGYFIFIIIKKKRF